MKNNEEIVLNYKRHLPHYFHADAVYFVTFRLYGSLPSDVIHRLKAENKTLLKATGLQFPEKSMRHLSNIRNKYFIQFDRHLDSLITGPDWLNNHEIAGIVETGIQFYHLKNYKLIAYTLMPNHVHMIVRMLKSGDGLSPYYLSNTIGRLKSFTAQKANQILKRTGPFWQQENYDHVVRNDGELSRIIEYILNNPVKAGLSETWEQYPYSYCKF